MTNESRDADARLQSIAKQNAPTVAVAIAATCGGCRIDPGMLHLERMMTGEKGAMSRSYCPWNTRATPLIG